MPVVPGAVVRPDPDADAGGLPGRGWQIDVGPRPQLEIRLAAAATRRAGPRLVSWIAAAIVGRQIRVSMLLEPDAVWQPTLHEGAAEQPVIVTLAKAPTTRVTAVRLHDQPHLAPQPQWQEGNDGTRLQVQVPSVCLGRRQALLIEAVAPLPPQENSLASVTLLEVAEEAWAGGGLVIEADPAQMIADFTVERAAVVAPGTAAAWRTPQLSALGGSDVEPARIYVEQQGPRPRVAVAVERRQADVNVQRVTVVDVSPEAVLARTTCDVTVQQGEAFELRGWLTKGWFIDTVELVVAPVLPPLGGSAGRRRRRAPGVAGGAARGSQPAAGRLHLGGDSHQAGRAADHRPPRRNLGGRALFIGRARYGRASW